MALLAAMSEAQKNSYLEDSSTEGWINVDTLSIEKVDIDLNIRHPIVRWEMLVELLYCSVSVAPHLRKVCTSPSSRGAALSREALALWRDAAFHK